MGHLMPQLRKVFPSTVRNKGRDLLSTFPSFISCLERLMPESPGPCSLEGGICVSLCLGFYLGKIRPIGPDLTSVFEKKEHLNQAKSDLSRAGAGLKGRGHQYRHLFDLIDIW